MAKKISVIIPNYNGEALLQKNLPEVLKTCKDCEIIIVDDGSQDNSVNIIKKYKKVKLIIQKENKGFAATVNNGVKNANGDLVLLLNSDIMPLPGFIKPLKSHFINNSKLFAVGCADNSYENNKIIVRGKGGASLQKGFILHYSLPTQAGETLWVSGGSGLFDRKKFIELGGFDTVFAPFYWEDIDLSYRARQAGYYCIFEPASRVNHFHELGAIKKSKPQKYIKSISYKNQFIFFWKNISDPIYIFQHLLFLPYHMLIAIKKKDWAFFIGFYTAALQIPQLIINYDKLHPKHAIKDRIIFNAFKK